MRVLLLLLLCSCVAAPALSADPLGPGAGPWVAESPEAHGLDTALLDAAAEEIWRIEDGFWAYHGLQNVTSRGCLVVIKDGALVYERYNTTGMNQHVPPQRWSKDSTQPGWSMTKTLGALLAGWAVTRGYLDLDKDITAAYGVPSPKSYPVTSREIMSQSLAGNHSPGEAWKYDAEGTGWINHMAQVVAAATGRNASQIWLEEFQQPLGLSKNFVWGGASPIGGEDPTPDAVWAYGSTGSCRDYARIMQLALNKGKWKGAAEPIVSAGYIEQMKSPQTLYPPHRAYANPCYGLLTWLAGRDGRHGPHGKYPGVCLVPENSSLSSQPQDWFPEGAPDDIYMAEGMGGQVAMVVPGANAVVVSMGQNSDPSHDAPVMYSALCKALFHGGGCPPGPPPIAASRLAAAADATICQLTASIREPPHGSGLRRVVEGRAAGLLNGMNLTAPANHLISPLNFSMWRGPIASWLWPGREGCTGVGTCCTPASCTPPFAELDRLAKFDLRQQYIASSLLTGQGDCEWQSFNNPLNPHNCSLPGGPSDPAFELWKSTIKSAANEAKRRGLSATEFYLDVWNEPNAQHKVECLVNSSTGPPCVFDANLTQFAFFKIWDVAHQTLRDAFPGARLVGPSLADGGPGLYGFERSVFPWLQAFLQHTQEAGTTPDVLTWHVSTLHKNASELVEHHRMLERWATAAGIKLPAIGHNEIVGPAAAVSPAANFGFLSVLEQLQADHSVKACYPDEVTKQSPCWDNTLDGLLTDNCMKDLGPIRASCDTLQRRPVYFAYKWYADAIGSPLGTFEASPGCGPPGTTVGLATRGMPKHDSSAKQAPVLATIVFGQWSEQKRPHGYKDDLQVLLRVELDTQPNADLADGEVLTVRVETLIAGIDPRKALPHEPFTVDTRSATVSNGTIEVMVSGFDTDGLVRVSLKRSQ